MELQRGQRVARRWLQAAAWALTVDFCPWANRWVLWVKHPLALLGLFGLLACVIGWSGVPQGYIVAVSVGAVMLLGIAWPWVGTLGLQASLEFERRRLREGERSGAILRVENRMPWPVWGLVLERGLDSSDPCHGGEGARDCAGIALALDQIPGFSRTDFRWEFEAGLRGEYPREAPRLSTAFPFGLWKWGCAVRVRSRLLVWPRIVPLVGVPPLQGASWSTGVLSPRCSGQEGEVLGTRPYRRGDLLRHVHWPQTARLGQWIVCERQAGCRTLVRLCVETRADVHFGTGPDSSFEWALRIAASFCRALMAHQVPLTVEWDGMTQVLEPGARGERRFNDALARLKPTQREGSGPSAGPRRSASARDPAPHVFPIVITPCRAVRPRGTLSSLPPRGILVVLHAGLPPCDPPQQLAPAVRWWPVDVAGDVAGQLRRFWSSTCGYAQRATL